jgi:hypothetical protein
MQMRWQLIYPAPNAIGITPKLRFISIGNAACAWPRLPPENFVVLR